MPTHGCIACPYRQAWCCICAGHQHHLYGPSGRPPPPATSFPDFTVQPLVPFEPEEATFWDHVTEPD